MSHRPAVHVDPAELAKAAADPAAAARYLAVVDEAHAKGGIVGVFLALELHTKGSLAPDMDEVIAELLVTARKRLEAYGVHLGDPGAKNLAQAIARWGGVDETDAHAVLRVTERLAAEQVLGAAELLRRAIAS